MQRLPQQNGKIKEKGDRGQFHALTVLPPPSVTRNESDDRK